ncbi:MAG: HAMP domain-containing sensor histidine kinase [Hyphomicrobiales bacterium]|nr:HAMP domain-containing sensor histidine kinase [Hyphomicrobiales bacterium]
MIIDENRNTPPPAEETEGVEPPDGGASPGRGLGPLGLSAKLLLLTILFVMISEVLIYVPSIANYRLTWLKDRLASAQIAALVLDATPDNVVPKSLEREILTTAGAMTIAVKRGGTRRLLMVSETAPDVADHFDLREMHPLGAIADAFSTLAAANGRIIRVAGTGEMGGDFIDIVLDETPLRRAMLSYSVNILTLSIIISMITATLVYLSLNWLLVRPMRRITRNMVRFRQDPEDPSRIIVQCGRSDEIGLAEQELAAMQKELAGTLQQKARLAALGLAVSKINHDLRNILANAHLISDRLSGVPDPTVQRFLPKLIASLDRAISLCADTIRYGRAREAPPERRQVALATLAEEIAEAAGLAHHASVRWVNAVDAELRVDADPEQLFRILMNLFRNAVDALESDAHASTEQDSVRLSGRREGAVVTIEISDTGPGVPARAREHLFEAFQASARPGGTGLGLAIAAELVRAHGGSIRLVDGTLGATFQIIIPDRVVELRSKRAG